ncbi:MAG: Na/Pi cotransporter family protein [Desulfobacteraceae bacterium]|nr:Na/Pi cotransporter family protein [Desulfobacteraceae bacterium]
MERKKTAVLIIIVLILFVFVCEGFSIEDISEEIPESKNLIYSVAVSVFAGFVFFLMGMDSMTLALKNFAGTSFGSRIKNITGNRAKGFFTGIVLSALFQSNSAATVMVVGFVQAGLVRFSPSLAIILGANVGATLTTQIIAFSIFKYAVFFVGGGFFLKIFSKKAVFKNIGNTLIGFGLLFYGMDLMSQAVIPLKESSDAVIFFQKFSSPFYSLLIGVVFTAVIQSSNASTGIAMVMAEGGLISVTSAISVMIGANIGTCVTALLACIGASREAKRTALGHLFFKTFGAVVFFSVINYFTFFSQYVTSFFSDSPSRIIANAHTLYNIGIALIFLPFCTIVSVLLMKVFPDKKSEYEIVFESVLDTDNLPPAEAALELAKNEISKVLGVLKEMVSAGALLFVKDKPPQDKRFYSKNVLEGIVIRGDEIRFLEEKISSYLFKVVRNDISRDKVAKAYAFISISKDLESIASLISKTLPSLYETRKTIKTGFSDAGFRELSEFQLKTLKQISRLKRVFDEPDIHTAAKIMKKEQLYLDLHMKYRASHFARIGQLRKESVETHKLHMGLMDLMISLIAYSGNIAKTYLEMPELKNE